MFSYKRTKRQQQIGPRKAAVTKNIGRVFEKIEQASKATRKRKRGR